MKILSADQIRQADRHTIASEPISSADLMERAAGACIPYILSYHRPQQDFIILCGKGNNGGDGLVIARQLADMGHTVRVYVLEYTDKASEDFTHHLNRLAQQGKATITSIYSDDEVYMTGAAIIIDAILGTGISRPTEGLIAAVIDRVNKSGMTVIAIDVPSGLSVDEPSHRRSSIIHARATLTFQQPKLAFLFPESVEYVGDFEVLDIGLDTSFRTERDCPYSFTQESDIAPLLRPRSKFSHKGTFGHSLLMAGSYGKMGAAVLSAHACLRSGTGLLTTHIPACGYQIMQTSLPEAMVSIDKNEEHLTALPENGDFKSIGIGPGIGKSAATAKLVKTVIQSVQVPMVMDADALNILSDNKTWLAFLSPLTVLTPHPKEFDRLTKVHSDSWQRLESARELARKHRIIIVLKGAYTAVVQPDGAVWFNSTGNPALAKGGSGDILTGIITALLGRGYGPPIAAAIAVYIHGLAADLAVRDIHAESLLPSDVIGHLSDAFAQLYQQQGQ